MTPSRKGLQSGKQWLEFLALELGVNAIQLKDAICQVNREVRLMTTGAIRGQFTEERKPSEEFQALVRLTLSRLIAQGKLGNWREDLHSYTDFCSSAPIIKAPMRFDRHHLRSVPSYIASYVVIRATFEDRIDVDYLCVQPPLPNGAYPIDWWLKELVDGRDDFLLHRGFGYLSNRQFSIEVARAVSEREARIVKLSVSRNDNDHPSRLVGIKVGCCAIDGAPHARRVHLMKVADKKLDHSDWRRVVQVLEADIAANGPGDMEFPEIHAASSTIRDIPDRLGKLAAETLARPTNDSAAFEPKRTARAQRKKA